MNIEEWNQFCRGDLSESEKKMLQEGILRDAISFLNRIKNKLIKWYKDNRYNDSFRERQEIALRKMLADRGVEIPGGDEGLKANATWFPKLRAWLNKVGAHVLEKVLNYMLFLVEPSLGKDTNTRNVAPQIFDVLTLGASVIAASMGLWSLSAMFLGFKMSTKAFRHVLSKVTTNMEDGEMFEAKNRQKAIQTVIQRNIFEE